VPKQAKGKMITGGKKRKGALRSGTSGTIRRMSAGGKNAWTICVEKAYSRAAVKKKLHPNSPIERNGSPLARTGTAR